MDFLRVRQDLGRSPSKEEYLLASAFSYDTIKSVFGGWQKFINATGVNYSIRGKIDKEANRKEAFEHLKKEIEEKKKIVPPQKAFSRVVAWGDLHFPTQHPDAVEWMKALNAKYKFDLSISIGDEINAQAFSFHTHDPDLPSPGHELEQAIKAMEPLYKEFPVMLIAESNHGSMVYRKAKANGLPVRVMRSYREVLGAPEDWEWMEEINIELSNGQRCLFHHSYSESVLNASQRRGENLVCGHKHNKFSIEYWANKARNFFAAQTGCLIDDVSMAYAYNKLGVNRPLIGSLGIFDGHPVLLPMHFDKHGRWNGKLFEFIAA